MKFEIEIRKAEARGEARGKLINSLETAQAMIETHDFEYISKLLKLPIEHVQALSDGCSVEAIMDMIQI